MRFSFYLVLFLCVACVNWSNSSNDKTYNRSPGVHRTIQIKYAKGFTTFESDSSIFIQVNNPWSKGDKLATYLLVKKGNKEEFSNRADFVIEAAPERVAVMSSTYLGMFKLLGEENRVVACNNAKLIYDSVLYNRFLRGELINLGESMEMNAEAVIGSSPDLLMKYIYGSREIGDEKVIAAGIPIAYNLEFMESHPLGRAEWIKFVAAFIGKDTFADSVFGSIEEEYMKLSDRARHLSDKPTVLDGSSYKGVWYAAGGRSFPARLYADAGASYYWESDSNRGSIPLSFEVIIDNQVDADFWIGPSTGSRKELLNIESRYALLKSFKSGNVFHFGRRCNPNGGLDYYESGVVRPDILLKDLLWVFHRELLDSSYQPVYIGQIME